MASFVTSRGGGIMTFSFVYYSQISNYKLNWDFSLYYRLFITNEFLYFSVVLNVLCFPYNLNFMWLACAKLCIFDEV
jgi:hypothetical protein